MNIFSFCENFFLLHIRSIKVNTKILRYIIPCFYIFFKHTKKIKLFEQKIQILIQLRECLQKFIIWLFSTWLKAWVRPSIKSSSLSKYYTLVFVFTMEIRSSAGLYVGFEGALKITFTCQFWKNLLTILA